MASHSESKRRITEYEGRVDHSPGDLESSQELKFSQAQVSETTLDIAETVTHINTDKGDRETETRSIRTK
jgi:hypothetical protein